MNTASLARAFSSILRGSFCFLLTLLIPHVLAYPHRCLSWFKSVFILSKTYNQARSKFKRRKEEVSTTPQGIGEIFKNLVLSRYVRFLIVMDFFILTPNMWFFLLIRPLNRLCKDSWALPLYFHNGVLSSWGEDFANEWSSW